MTQTPNLEILGLNIDRRGPVPTANLLTKNQLKYYIHMLLYVMQNQTIYICLSQISSRACPRSEASGAHRTHTVNFQTKNLNLEFGSNEFLHEGGGLS